MNAPPAHPATPADPRYDEWLVVRCQLGERDAFETLIRRWHGPIRGYARRLCGDDELADEIAQDTWLRVLRGIAGLHDGARLRAWLFGIARRALMDRLRGRYSAPPRGDETDLDSLPGDEAAPEQALDHAMDLDRLQRGLDRLPLIEREALSLFYLQQLSLQDIAQVLELPVGTVKSRLFRARGLLRLQLNPTGADR
ncbi:MULTISPECIES: RNA polymerase sigma factor [unclassified Lysobacter]|uniref:RNA polymerase sigma factor n=1 Tax=unclassified Lysobacter TaxID=2635362 RepID=UPI001BE54BF1|nr:MULTISPECIES: RNA polymerase sigma factor [unclassified Lysobacter]MBT2749040.1 RNA polymerase sigma factor [Lysobacter sp. ISL-42]MBT2750373.1 RNA polymerase sigma factor [Lysobacter sp. ISL-50]MBT2778471.1 RNA polymerase sigma factor [Lysobacter sp. ISL-54]MBT2781087.1 RNA polymerase sigma factor [Lysobacter sp. ISL-52]